MDRTVERLRFRIRKGDFEVEVEGNESFVKQEYERLLPRDSAQAGTESRKTSHDVERAANTNGNIPSTLPDRFQLMREGGFFQEPQNSGDVTKKLRDLGWGVYLSKDVSSALKRSASKLGLRRVPLGNGKYGYAYP